MAEKKEMHIDNIKKISEMIKDGKLDALVSTSGKIESEVKSVKNALEEKFKALVAIRKEKEEQTAKEPVKEEKVSVKGEVKASQKVAKPVEEEKTSETEKTVFKSAVEEKKEEVEVKVEEKVEKPSQNEKKPAEFVPPARPSFIVRREGPIVKPEKKTNERPPRAEFKPKQGEFKREGFKPQGQGEFKGGAKPEFNRGGGKKPQASTYVAPPVIPTSDKRSFNNKKKQGGDKQYEEKHVISKRALIKNQVDIDDFDENKSGYRKFRPVKKEKKAEVNVIKIEKAVINTEIIPLKVLSEKIGITAAEITKRLFKEGIMKTINDSIDFDTAAFIADDLGIELELKLDKTAEDVLSEGFDSVEESAENLRKRPPVVTVTGHVDQF